MGKESEGDRLRCGKIVLYGSKSKMAAKVVDGSANFFPNAPIFNILVSKVMFWGAANPMNLFPDILDH